MTGTPTPLPQPSSTPSSSHRPTHNIFLFNNEEAYLCNEHLSATESQKKIKLKSQQLEYFTYFSIVKKRIEHYNL